MKIFPRLAVGLLLLICTHAGTPAHCVAAQPWPPFVWVAGQGLPTVEKDVQARRRMSVPPVTHFHGASITLKPDRQRPALTVTITNRGNQPLTLWSGYSGGWSLLAFGEDGRAVPPTERQRARWRAAPMPARIPSPCKLGGSLGRSFKIGHYREITATGIFYIYATRWVSAGARTAIVRSPILKLTLRNGRPPDWNVVPSVPQPETRPHPVAPLAATPPYPPHKIPGTGPIAVLAEICTAVNAGDLKRVTQLCYRGGAAREPFILASAEEAAAVRHYCMALQKRFGVNPEKRMTSVLSTPESFSHFLEELNPSSLKIDGDRASAGILWFNGKQFVSMPKFAFRFRKVNGHWLLDSRATYRGTLTPRQYRLNVENALKQATVLRSLTRDLQAGKFSTLKDLTAAADRRMVAVGHWFQSQSLKGAAKTTAGAPAKQAAPPQPPAEFHGVGITAAPGPGATLTATVANHGPRTAFLHGGAPFGWSLFAFGANGRGLGVRRKQQAMWRSSARTNKPIPLAPGMSLHKTFKINAYCVLPSHGTFYLYVTRFVTIGGISAPIRSSIFQLVLRKGSPPHWRFVATMPQPKTVSPPDVTPSRSAGRETGRAECSRLIQRTPAR